jgi:hypothetical protein
MESEKARYTDYIMKLNAKNLEEKDVLLTQLNKSEYEINNYKNEITRQVRQINELNKVSSFFHSIFSSFYFSSYLLDCYDKNIE